MKTKKVKPDYIFKCRKCTYLVYVTKSSIMKMEKTECPDCGEEASGNWIFIGEGDFDNRNPL